MQKVIEEIRGELLKNVDLVYKKGFVKYVGGEIKNYGVRTPYVRKISRQYFVEIRNKSKQEIFALCQELLESDIMEEAIIAFGWAKSLAKQYEKSDFNIFERWLNIYVNNWAKCDDFCTHAFGQMLIQFPEFLPKIKKEWTKSDNRWMKRGAAVILIPFVKQREGGPPALAHVFEVAELLLMDKDDLVQKGYGWMLKEAANKYQREVFEFVLVRKNWMPRTALRYAIEKMPNNLRLRAMAK